MNKTHCILPGRFDVARHWLRTGGLNALREPFSQMVRKNKDFFFSLISKNGFFSTNLQKRKKRKKTSERKKFRNLFLVFSKAFSRSQESYLLANIILILKSMKQLKNYLMILHF